MATDWSSVPAMVTSGELFDGELFGDELIDIYNSTVAESHGLDVDANEIPHLLIPTDDRGMHHHQEDDGHPGMRVAAAAAAMDDGLGAFRPSTSFNDLTTLLTPNGKVKSQVVGKISKAGGKSETGKAAKKRKNAATDSPTTKKRATPAARGGRKSPAKKAGSHGQGKGKTADSVELDPPNPLYSEVPLAPLPSRLMVYAPSSPPREIITDKMTSPVSPTNSTTPSEADFKSIAQAAVSSLMASATKDEAPMDLDVDSGKVDTSTAHIKALTGNNWVAACTGSMAGISSGNSVADSKSNNNRARRQNLTPDERARQNRDRNREHARNTRLRKKAYVEELKRTLTELVAQRDAADVDKRQGAQRDLEQREVRFRVIEEFLKLRGRNEPNSSRWAIILEDGFRLTLPPTSFRKMAGEGATEQVLEGLKSVMTDASYFADFLQTLGANSASDEVIAFQYNGDRKNFFMDDCCAMLEWDATSVGATKKGCHSELALKGFIRARFSPASNKLVSATMSFDTGSIFSQLRTINEKAGFDCHDETEAVAAQEAASQADAILDSLQMPRLSGAVPSAATLVPASLSSSDSDCTDKGETSCDESVSESNDKEGVSETGVATRRASRRSG